MQFDIGGILAKCFSCGSNDFAPLRSTPAEPHDRLACARCCTEVVYEGLLSQIGRTAIAKRNAGRPSARRKKPGAPDGRPG
jgi:hypothetical protein